MFEKYTSVLTEKDGINYAPGTRKIYYPSEGNDMCYSLEENSFWFSHRNNCILEVARKFPPQDIFFDIGGGNGFVSRFLEDNGIATAVLEPGLQGCINSKKRGLKRIICSTFEDAGFRHGTVFSAGMFDVLEHIENDRKALESLSQYFHKDGLLFITVPAYKFLWSKEDDDTGHFRRYTLAGLQNLLSVCGFRTEYSTYIFSALPLPVFISRTLPTLLNLSRDSSSAEKHMKEHEGRKGVAESILDKIWKYELRSIRKGSRIPFGTSCLTVARKL